MKPIELLQLQYPGVVFLSVAETARAIDMTEQTLRNDISRGRFPVKTIKLKRRRVIPLIELAKYLDKLHSQAAVVKKTGRPRGTKLARGRA